MINPWLHWLACTALIAVCYLTGYLFLQSQSTVVVLAIGAVFGWAIAHLVVRRARLIRARLITEIKYISHGLISRDVQ